MIESMNVKVTPKHLNQRAYLYVRQSTLRQVIENKESTKRQYALKNKAPRAWLARITGHDHRFRPW